VGLGFSMKIAPGVRVRASSRGISAGLGPRAARVHVGSRGVGVSTGVGPFSAYGHSGGGRRTTQGVSRTAYERQFRQQARAEQVQDALDLVNAFQESYLHVHRQRFSLANAPEARPAQPVDERAMLTQARKKSRTGISFWRRSDRRAAREKAEVATRHDASTIAAAREEERRVIQSEMNATWDDLLANHRDTVLAALEAAFADNEAPAAAVDCEGSTISVAMSMPERDDIVPDVQPTVTLTGRPTVKALTKTARNHLFLGAVLSHALVTAKEAFAVAPALETVLLLALVNTDGTLRPVYVAAYTRDDFDRVDWTNDNAVEIAGPLGGLTRMKGRTDELGCLPLGDDPEILLVAKQVAEGLGVPLDPNAAKLSATER
jgi:hypothetical protein